MSAYSPPTRRIPSCSSDYPQCEAEAHTLFPLPSHQIKAQNLSFLKRYRQIFSFRVLKRQILLPFAQKQTKTLSVFAVALHPEGVDRNFHGIQCFLIELWSPSTRRAWIEIGFSDPFSDAVTVAHHPEGGDIKKTTWCLTLWKHVALHPEGVDRNSRRVPPLGRVDVALHPEGVDRNPLSSLTVIILSCRPPPGGRG